MISRRKLPSLNSLRAFETAGRRLSFRAAADELGVTQGAIAQQVRALEEQLGIPLFQRLARGLALTPSGMAYLINVTRAFDLLTEATESLLVQPNIVTISVTPTVASKLLIPRLGELHAMFPDIKLNTLATEALSDLNRDAVDIAVRLTNTSFPKALEAQLLFHQELIVVAHPHLVKDFHLPLTTQQLLSLPLLQDAHNNWPKFLNSNSQLFGPVFNQTTLALDAALAGQGVALVCKAFVEDDLNNGRLVQIMTETVFLESSYYLVRKRSLSPKESVDIMWNWCLEKLKHSQSMVLSK
ncbi:LysR substrate-binding domain-containing protein [Acinetobacter sp. MB5]|uniref:LysR substrate-binding domain-containing protein n=1 Tax=Acinetobacter sp. MB5 TaxID=2069438 RepID=UPI000DD0D823|nr:LysR substrate-binding domain-containing protein [Acinetobacter sp. MB5]